MTSHNPRPLDEFLKKLPEYRQGQISWIDEEGKRLTALPQRIRVEGYRPRAQLSRELLESFVTNQLSGQLEPWQRDVLRRHPAFRNLRQDPNFQRLTHQTQIRPVSLWSRLLRRLRIR